MRREMQVDVGSRPDRSLEVSVGATTPSVSDGLPPVRLSFAKGAWHLQTYLTPEECYELSAILTACAMEVETAERKASEEDAAEAEGDARKLDERLGFDG